MKTLYLRGLIVLLGMALVGCNEASPKLTVEKKGIDSIHRAAETITQAEQNIKIVTGEKAATLDDKRSDGIQEKDKNGAVAVKMGF